MINRKNVNMRGSVLIYILIAIALIAALSAVFMQPSSQQSRSQNSFRTAAELSGQVNMIRAALQDCILQFSEGDSNITEVGYHGVYPLNPDSDYLPSPDYRAANRNVEHLRCPGNNPGGADRAKHREMFGAATGRFLPAAPALFTPWEYFNGTSVMQNGVQMTGVYIETRSTASDAFVKEAMQRLQEQHSACEVEYIEGSGTNGCADKTTCLRFWIKRVEPEC